MGLAVLSTLSLVELCVAGAPKEVDPSDPGVVAAKTFFEEDLNAKFNETEHEVVHFCDAQRQVVNGFNFILTVVVKAFTEETDDTDWVLHKLRIYEHPAWDTSSENKYELSLDDVPVYEDAGTELSSEATEYVETNLGSSSKLTGVLSHTEQRLDLEYLSLSPSGTLASETVEVVGHTIHGTFVVDEIERYADVHFVTKGDKFIFFDHLLEGEVKHKGGELTPGGKDVKLLTMKTSMFAIFLVGVLACGILLVHVFRKRQKRSKEDWYIEQLTDIDEL